MAGIIESRVPWATYAAIEAVNVSRLKRMDRSPLHYRHAVERETGPMRLGTAAHCATLEPERYARDYAVWGERTDGGNLRPRRGKDYDAFVESVGGRKVLTADEDEAARTIAAAVRGDETAARYLASGEPEVTLQWRDGRHACKGRVDWVTRVDGVRVLVGLKTARDCRHFVFSSAAAKLGYHLQWAYYRDGYEAITSHVAKVVEIVVESEPPHAVATYVIPAEIIEQGRDEYRVLLDRLGVCLDEDRWPGPVEGEEILSLPSWVYRDESDSDLSELGLTG